MTDERKASPEQTPSDAPAPPKRPTPRDDFYTSTLTPAGLQPVDADEGGPYKLENAFDHGDQVQMTFWRNTSGTPCKPVDLAQLAKALGGIKNLCVDFGITCGGRQMPPTSSKS